MQTPQYLTLEQARQVLAEMGIKLNSRQMKRAAEKNAKGQRKLPFFIDPIDKKLKIEKGALIAIYNQRAREAEKKARFSRFKLEI